MKKFSILLNISAIVVLLLFMSFDANAQSAAKTGLVPVDATVVKSQSRGTSTNSQPEKVAKKAKQNAPKKNYLKSNNPSGTIQAKLVESDSSSNVYVFKNTKWTKEGLEFIEYKMNAANIKGLVKAEMNQNNDEVKLHLDKNISKADRDHIFTAAGYKNYQIKS